MPAGVAVMGRDLGETAAAAKRGAYWPGCGVAPGRPGCEIVPMPPSNSSKKLRLRPSVGVLSFDGLIAATKVSSVVFTDSTLPAWSKRTWRTDWSTTRGLRNANERVSRDK